MAREDSYFTSGRPRPAKAGRKKGSTNRVPAGFKASRKRIFEEIAQDDPALYREAVERGLRAAPPKRFPYLQLAAHYLDGRPTERTGTGGTGSLRIVFHGVERGYDPLAEKSRMLARQRAERQAAALPEPKRTPAAVPSDEPDPMKDEDGEPMDML